MFIKRMFFKIILINVQCNYINTCNKKMNILLETLIH